MSSIPNSVPSLGLGGANNANNTGVVPSPVVIDAANTLGFFTLSSIARNVSITAGNFGIFVKNGAQYQVPNGKTCKVVAIALQSANADWQLAHSLTQMANNASSITSGTYEGLVAGANGCCHFATGTNIWNHYLMTYEFPSLSYPCFQTDTTTVFEFILVCREV